MLSICDHKCQQAVPALLEEGVVVKDMHPERS